MLLAERLAAEPSSTLRDPFERAPFGLADETAEKVDWWSRRLRSVHAGFNGARGFSETVSKYLGKKYGDSPEAGAAVGDRVAELLRMLAGRLKSQHRAGSRYYVGNSSPGGCLQRNLHGDVRPASPAQCKMEASTRAAFESRDGQIEAALDPIFSNIGT